MGGFASGVADGQLLGRLARAESSAAFLGAAAYEAERREKNTAVTAEQWKAKAVMYREKINEYCGAANAGVVVMNAIIQVLDEMSPSDRDRFKERLVNIARARILKMDSEAEGTHEFVGVEKAMRKLKPNDILGIV